MPKEFMWPKGDVSHAPDDYICPVVDLEGFLKGDKVETQLVAKLIQEACSTNGFFQVINHGIDSKVISIAHDHIKAFFKLPISTKQRVRRKEGQMWGYSGLKEDSFASEFPLKETLSFGFDEMDHDVVEFFESGLGKEFEQTGLAYKKYCKTMKELSFTITEILGISLGLDRNYYRDYFKDGTCIMRCNFYPPRQEPGLALGTGPHCDPTALTILYQDEVGGLEVLVNNKWMSVQPTTDALLVNIGDTFTALSNGRYKSCLHRAIVNPYKERISLAFFLCPRGNKVVRPQEDLVCIQWPRKYPDFTWSDLFEFTQKDYRVDESTLQNFTKWFLSSQPSHF